MTGRVTIDAPVDVYKGAQMLAGVTALTLCDAIGKNGATVSKTKSAGGEASVLLTAQMIGGLKTLGLRLVLESEGSDDRSQNDAGQA